MPFNLIGTVDSLVHATSVLTDLKNRGHKNASLMYAEKDDINPPELYADYSNNRQSDLAKQLIAQGKYVLLITDIDEQQKQSLQEYLFNIQGVDNIEEYQ